MGTCLSCCRRRRTPEREPLLPKHRTLSGHTDPISSPHTPLDHTADVLAAFKAGKLPSQEQLENALQAVLRSDILDVGSVDGGYGTLSEGGRKIVEDIREVLEAVLQMGVEKNSDDVLQHLLYHCRKVDSGAIHADVAVDASGTAADMETAAQQLPSQAEVTEDAGAVVHSIAVLTRVLITSSTFIAVVSDLIATAREIVADTAADVGRVASRVQDTSEKIERAARPDSGIFEDTKGKAAEAGDDVLSELAEGQTSMSWDTIGSTSPDRAKEAVVFKLQESVLRASRTPAHQEALRTILRLLRKYSIKTAASISALSDAQTPKFEPAVWAEPPLAMVLSDFKTILERLASGHSLDTFLETLQVVATDVINIPSEVASGSNDSRRELQAYLSDIGEWFDRALSSPKCTVFLVGRLDAETLYDRGRALVNEASHSNAECMSHLRKLIHELDVFISAVASDPTSRRLLQSLDMVAGDIAQFSTSAVSNAPVQARRSWRRWRRRLQRDFLLWLLPRILRVIKTIPMPRIEYKSSTLDVVVDALRVTPSASFVPDQIRVENYSELQVDIVENVPAVGRVEHERYSAGVQACTRAKLHVKGLRVSAKDIGYYVRYKGWHGLFAYEDQGLVSVDVGRQDARGEGLGIDMELLLESDEDEGSESDNVQSFFRVADVSVGVPGLQFAISRSKHALLNKVVVQPLSGPLVRGIAGHVLAQQIRRLLETLGRFLAGVQRTAEGLHGEQEPGHQFSLEDYWEAILLNVGSTSAGDDDEASEASTSAAGSDSQTPPLVETHTKATLQGIVRTTVTQPDPSSSNPPTPDESTLAVGIGPQILPDKGGPVDEPTASRYGAVDIARDAAGEVQQAADKTQRELEEGACRAAEVREDIEVAQERGVLRERVERRRGGWRSRAFDINIE